MKKLLLASAALALSTTFAFAAPDLFQGANLTQSIGKTFKGGEATNAFLGAQIAVPVNSPKSDITQKIDAKQTIGDTFKGGEATNKAIVIQAGVPLQFGAP